MWEINIESNFGVNVLGHISGEYGLGEAVRSNIRAMEMADIPLTLKDMKVEWHRNLDTSYTDFTDDNHYPINFVHINPEEVKEVDPKYFKGKYNIGFWAWESPIFPPDRLWAFDYFDEIWTPSNYSGDAISMASSIPVIRIPHSISVPQPSLTREDLDLPQDKFIFLFMFDLHGGFARKNPLATIKAFRQAFGKSNPDVLLILKFSNSKYHSERLEQIQSFVGDDDSIVFFDFHLMRDEIDALMYSVDSYISLHRSEGFGLTIAESMYLGKPVIATGYSSNIEFMNVGNSYLVEYDLIELEEDAGVFQKGNQWADPSVAHAAKLMKHLVDNPEEAKKVG
ncbi:MAG: glycosyltransferase, partial [Patescibacteria group bacterium]